MDRTYLICISAPLNAFAAERRSLFERILDMNHIPFGREDCPADASGADDIMRRRIAASDYVVALIAETLPSDVREAEAQGVPVLLLALRGAAPRPAENIENSKQFSGLSDHQSVRYWSADEDFGRAAEAALLDLFGRKPSRGYVRGSMAPPDVPRETTIVTMDKTPAPDANHANPNRDDQTTAPELQGLRTALEAFAVEIGAFEHNRYVTKPLTLLDVFVETHYSFHAGLAPTDFLCLVLEVYNARIVKPDEHKLLNELVALRLLEPRLSLKPTTGRFSSATLFVLSALGQDFAAQIRALRAHQMMEHFHSPESD